MATEEAHTEDGADEEQKEQLQSKSRVCDYYISSRGCVKVSSTTRCTAVNAALARPSVR